jgi:hypothetical protein
MARVMVASLDSTEAAAQEPNGEEAPMVTGGTPDAMSGASSGSIGGTE